MPAAKLRANYKILHLINIQNYLAGLFVPPVKLQKNHLKNLPGLAQEHKKNHLNRLHLILLLCTS